MGKYPSSSVFVELQFNRRLYIKIVQGFNPASVEFSPLILRIFLGSSRYPIGACG
jgi:hypothetical protein